jgi:diaminopimelate epimerase
MHALGNDYIIFNSLFEVNDVPPHLIRNVCKRHYGIGADGVIILLPSDKTKFKATIYNSDGSEAEISGNGIRCLGRYIYDLGILRKKNFSIETLAGVKDITIIEKEGLVDKISVNMGKPEFKREKIPMKGKTGDPLNEEIIVGKNQKILASCLSIGNPHCVIWVDDIKKAPVKTLGFKLERYEIFPNNTNVEFVKVKNKNEIFVRTWERGVGETESCGTGACASVVASVLKNKTKRKVNVSLLGGNLEVLWRKKDKNIILTGKVDYVYKGKISDSWLLSQYERD